MYYMKKDNTIFIINYVLLTNNKIPSKYTKIFLSGHILD